MKILEWICPRAVLPGQVSVFSLTAGKHVLIYTATVKVTASWGKKEKCKGSPPAQSFEVNFYSSLGLMEYVSKTSKKVSDKKPHTYLWVWEIIFNNC